MINSQNIILYIAIFIFILIYGVKIIAKVRKKEITYHNLIISITPILCVSLLAILVFWKYLSFNEYFVFRDIASDSFGQFIPSLLNNSLKLESYGRVPFFNLSQYLGTAWIPINLFDGFTAYFGYDNVIKFLGHYQVVKMTLAGFLFYKYLRKIDRSHESSLLGCIAFSFCGHMIIRCTWASYAGDCIVIAALLYSFECYFKERKILPIVISMLLLCYTRNISFLIVYSIILLVYAIFRYFVEYTFRKKEFFRYYLELITILLGVILLSSAIVIPSIESIMSSSRISVSESATGIDLLSSQMTMLTSYFKTFANDIFGDALSYQGSQNYLEDAALYSGLLMIFLIPVSFLNAEKKKKVWYSIALLACVVYCILPPFRIMMNGFSKDTFKLSSLWIVIVFIYLGTIGFDQLRFYKINKIHILLPFFIIIVPLILLIIFKSDIVDMLTVSQILLFYTLYSIYFFIVLKKPIMNNKLIIAFILTFMVEVTVNSYRDINNRDTATMLEMYEDYDGGLLAAKDKIYANEQNRLFRIDYSAELTASMATDFFSTRGYIGGSGISKDLTEFTSLSGDSRIAKDGFTRYYFGFSNELNTLLGVKYLILKKNDDAISSVPYGYEYFDSIDGLQIFKNKYALPMIFTYNQTMSKDEFEKHDLLQQNKIMLQYLITDQTTNENIDIKKEPIISLNTTVNDLESGSNIVNLNDFDSDYFLLRVDYESDVNEKFDMILSVDYEGTSGTENYTYRSSAGKEYIEVAIENKGQKSLTLSTTADAVVNNVEVYNINENYFDTYKENINERKNNDFEITKFEEDVIEGNIDIQNEHYLYFSIPFDPNWNLYIDGVQAKLEKGNIAFMYANVESGNHEIKLEYEIKSYKFLNAIGLLMIVIVCFRKMDMS